ncbi:MAG: hypothetical protein A2V66_16025 [Ignavibacteria bacterium RBG_13_36_8]|nr:MAG: hypothetical protein A2V66_16025 [Ignavibacteria bacterium RBG_13_36_8]
MFITIIDEDSNKRYTELIIEQRGIMFNNIGRLILIILVLVSFRTTFMQQIYEVKKLSDNLYQFYQKEFVNMFAFITEEGIVLIDIGFDDVAESVKIELSRITDQKIKYIINTHSDYDHLAGNSKLRDGAVIINHEKCRDEMIMYGGPDIKIPFDKKHFHEGMPDITFSEGLTIHIADETVNLIPMYGGHSSSDIIVYLENDNVLFVGDIITPNSFPVVKLYRNSTVERLKEIIIELLDKFDEDTEVFVGHGASTTIAELKPYLEMINETESLILEKMKQEYRLEEIKEKNILNKYSQWSGTVFEEVNCDMWIETMYNNYKSDKLIKTE